MRRELLTALLAVIVLTVVCGVVYPLVVTGVAQVAFPGNADGSRVQHDGKTVGSKLIGQDFRRQAKDSSGKPKVDEAGDPVLVADADYFQSRPSADAYNPAGTFFSNLGPNQADLRDAIVANRDAYLGLERPYDRGLTRADVPADAAQTSASGVDPHISVANARIQAHRIAARRDLSLARVNVLIDEHTVGRFAGALGERAVNVLELNLAVQGASR